MARRAQLCNQRGIDLASAGQHEAALAPTREAVELYRSLAMRNPDAFLPDLAMSLNNLGMMLSSLGGARMRSPLPARRWSFAVNWRRGAPMRFSPVSQ